MDIWAERQRRSVRARLQNKQLCKCGHSFKEHSAVHAWCEKCECSKFRKVKSLKKDL